MMAVSLSLEKLNAAQKEAVVHTDGPAIVLAGAGSGKTTALTYRAAWLLEKGDEIYPENLLIVTFTNKAAHEIRERIESLTGLNLPLCGTFHSICAKLLRFHGKSIGIHPSFTIYDANDQLTLIKNIYKKHGYDTNATNPQSVKASISKAKNELESPSDFERKAVSQFQQFAANIYREYELELKKARALDFDDLLLKAVELLRADEAVRTSWQQRIKHVLIDEYQDTNAAQYELSKLLTHPQNNLFVVGDFSQSIYSWRGADYRNMLALKTDYPDCKEYRLEQNYRSTQVILDAATNIVSKNTQHPILTLWTENTDQTKITKYTAQTGEQEAAYVLRCIDSIQKTNELNDIAILYRTNAQSRLFEEALLNAGLPYQLIGGTKFYDRKEIKDVLSYTRIIANPDDTVGRSRSTKLGKRRLEKVEANRDMIEKLQTTDHPGNVIRKILEVSEYLKKYNPEIEEDRSRLENIQELLNVASQFTSLTQFLENISLVQDNQFADSTGKKTNRGVNLLSLHGAKGLEFKIVFLVGLEEELLPHSRSLLDPDQLEEERRLCYVGMTRAKEKLYLTLAMSRYLFGSRSNKLPSRFLRDIPRELVENIEEPSEYTLQPFMSSKPYSTKRTLIVDDDMLEDVLSGKLSIDAFIDS